MSCSTLISTTWLTQKITGWSCLKKSKQSGFGSQHSWCLISPPAMKNITTESFRLLILSLEADWMTQHYDVIHCRFELILYLGALSNVKKLLAFYYPFMLHSNLKNVEHKSLMPDNLVSFLLFFCGRGAGGSSRGLTPSCFSGSDKRSGIITQCMAPNLEIYRRI